MVKVERLNVNPTVLLSYIQSSNTPFEILKRKIPNIEKFLSGEQLPTFNQLSELGKLINVPTGLLMLRNKIEMENIKLDFRTIDSQRINEMSSELRDTILEMQNKQEFLQEQLENDCDFVGSFNYSDDFSKVVEGIRNYLGYEINRNRFENYREKMSKLGVFIFLNGKVKDNTSRSLDLKEFRGFVLTDKKAPIIFINQKDTKSGRLFTLVHEFVHLFFGESDLFDDNSISSRNKVEAIVNKITGEILVPQSLIIEKYDDTIEISKNIDVLHRYFEVSKFVIVRRLLDLRKITKQQFEQLNSQIEKENENFLNSKATNGGNYKNNIKFRIDKNFFNYVNNAVLQNRITYTDAFNIVGVGYKGYKILQE